MAYTDYQRITPEGYVRVVNSADYDPIVSYEPLPDITVNVDAVVNLPNTVQATYKSGKIETLIVKWERVSVDTSTAGTQKIYGDIGNGAAAVLQNVIVNELSDLDILRQIRDANPTSQLPSLWLDSEDPYTQWDGVLWDSINGIKKVGGFNFTGFALYNENVGNIDFSLFRMLKYLRSIECQGVFNLIGVDIHIDASELTLLTSILWTYRNLKSLNIMNCNSLLYLNVQGNKLPSIQSLTSRGSITTAKFTGNKFDTSEVNRLLSIGFTAQEIGTQNP